MRGRSPLPDRTRPAAAGAGCACRVNGSMSAITTATEPTISAAISSAAHDCETPSASELLIACRAIGGSSEPVRW